MKKIIFFLACSFFAIHLFAQAPQRLSYQAIIRNANNVLVANAPIKMRLSIIKDSINGTPVYTELHSTTTNTSGVAFVQVGGGTSPSGSFSSINWAQGSYFLRSETDPNNGTNYTIVGTTQLLSVPYALQSNRADSSAKTRRADSSNFANNGLPSTSLHGALQLYRCNGKIQYTPCQPLLTTTSLSSITGFTAISGGNITSDGGSGVTARGVVWSTAVNPTIALSTKTSNGTGGGSFSSTLTNLTPNTVYYVRAYATNNVGTTYGNQISLITGKLPVVSTNLISSISTNGATSGGNVTDSGNAPVTSKGIVWSTTQNPTIALATKTNDGAGIGSFISSLTTLTPNTLYYVRAYATNSAGTAYGSELSFSSLFLPASLTSLNCAGSKNNGFMFAGKPASGISSLIPYTGSNGGNYTAQMVSSTIVTGLTATISPGTLSNGNGELSVSITGTPVFRSGFNTGSANFTISIGGQTCTLTRIVDPVPVSGITAHSCGAIEVHNPAVAYGSMTDQQGNVYRTVQIGSQMWMAENLRTTTYRNSSPINFISDNVQWKSTTAGAYCSYNNTLLSDCPYGKLYNWYAVTNSNQLCPLGWHVPTQSDWETLTSFIGSDMLNGCKLKSTGTNWWEYENYCANNSTGFSALAGGSRDSSGTFKSIRNYGTWWSSTADTAPLSFSAWRYYLWGGNGYLFPNRQLWNVGYSIRCVRD